MYKLSLVKAEVSFRSGRGPEWDPYHYDECTWTARDGSVTIKVHLGLGCWVEVDGVRTYEWDEHNLHPEEIFRRFTGFYVSELMEYQRRARSRCKCGNKRFYQAVGYPGEHFTCCTKCHEVVDGYFDESAII